MINIMVESDIIYVSMHIMYADKKNSNYFYNSKNDHCV